MVQRCDVPGCFEKAPQGLSLYGVEKPHEDSVELLDEDLCKKHYTEKKRRLLAAIAL